MPEALYADVIVDISIDSLDKSYQYRIPDGWEEKVTAGMPVMIPFGRGNRQIKGYIVGLTHEPKVEESKIKCVTQLISKGITASEQLLELAYWMKDRYGSTMNEAIKTVLPVKRKIKEVESRKIVLKLDNERAKAVYVELKNKKNAAARIRLLQELIKYGSIDYQLAKNKLNISMQTINSLSAQGVVSVETTRVYRNPVKQYEERDLGVTLNAEQQAAVDGITDDYKAGKRNTYLIHGVTGSGKTEVYMAIMEQVIKDGKQVIMLIPEIALTYQTVMRFYKRFGDRISILNSRMSAGERYDQYERAKNGDIDIVIGPRSALFIPFENLGLIVMDEEHEGSYKSEMPPKYHARETAEKRAELADAILVLGSATPSLETYYRTTSDYQNGDRIVRYELNQRTGTYGLPEVDIVDMRDEFKQKNYSMFSRLLGDKIRERLEKHEQIMLFINRRGYQGFVSCRSCGEVVKCPHCDVSLTVHRVNNTERLVCHYCGYEKTMIRQCQACGSKYIGGFGTGTQQIEDMVKNSFPNAKVLRMDADTTTGKEGHNKILEKFAGHEADVLVGTQMIVKGHDFPLVTLVGIIAADLSLHISDYRAAERTFQLLVQAEGRAGRGNRKGNVVVQTYQPDHYAVVSAARQDYREFYDQEIVYRQLMQYPPVAHIMTVFVSCDVNSMSENIITLARRTADTYAETMLLSDSQEMNISIIGPAPHPVAKANDMYRYLMYIKCEDTKQLGKLRDLIESKVEKVYEGVRFVMQFDLN